MPKNDKTSSSSVDPVDPMPAPKLKPMGKKESGEGEGGGGLPPAPDTPPDAPSESTEPDTEDDGEGQTKPTGEIGFTYKGNRFGQKTKSLVQAAIDYYIRGNHTGLTRDDIAALNALRDRMHRSGEIVLHNAPETPPNPDTPPPAP